MDARYGRVWASAHVTLGTKRDRDLSTDYSLQKAPGNGFVMGFAAPKEYRFNSLEATLGTATAILLDGHVPEL
ncbi:hypothetical protein NHX12_013429 [Muraenolepis orangiensis]|uniref:Uncharacterized protein n=1 Tax=Muraenolepis orangiensis TaxID=630683 RepID=A0A9Q0DEP2_9TELE|nr:hypothetical protein NHX12_013429 [Muraenolepis orangiensis]